MNFTRKHRIVVSLAAVAVIGAGIYAGTRPFSVSHAPTRLAVADTPPPPPGGSTMSEGDCSGTAGQENSLSKASVDSIGNFSITYSDETAWACNAWLVNGAVVQPSAGPGTMTETFNFKDPTYKSDTVSFFIVDGDHGGNWDMFTWTDGTPSSSSTVTFAPGCTASAGSEKLISNPSQYAAPEPKSAPAGVGVDATYNDESPLTCHEWYVNGILDNSGDCSPNTNSTNEDLCYTFTPAQGFIKTITLDVVDSDHTFNWDQFTWTPPACYPPGPSKLVDVTDNNGTVAGTLENRCGTPVGSGHQVTETFTLNSTPNTKMAPTNGQGRFQFPPVPPNGNDVKVFFKGDATVPPSNTVSCTSPNGPCS